MSSGGGARYILAGVSPNVPVRRLTDGLSYADGMPPSKKQKVGALGVGFDSNAAGSTGADHGSYAAGSSGTGHGGSTSSAGATRPILPVHTRPLAMNPDKGITVRTSYGHITIYGQDELMASPRGLDLLEEVRELTGCTVGTPGDPSIDLRALAMGCNRNGHGHSSGEGASSNKTKVDTALQKNPHLGWIDNVARKLLTEEVSAPS